MDALTGFFTPIAPSFTAAVTDVAFLISLVIAVIFCFLLSPGTRLQNGFIRCFMLFLGLIVGCIAAILAVPFDPSDSALYSPISAALGLVVTGYIASQLGPVAKTVFIPSANQPPDWTKLVHLTFCLVGVALSAIVIVVNRTEWIAQAVRCNPDYYARLVPQETRNKMPRDQKTCERLHIGASSDSSTGPMPVYKSLSIFPYSMAYIRALPWRNLEQDQCLYNVKFTGTSGVWLECKTADIGDAYRLSLHSRMPPVSEHTP